MDELVYFQIFRPTYLIVDHLQLVVDDFTHHFYILNSPIKTCY